MATDGLEAKRRLTFGQTEGLEPLPRQLDKTEMPAKLRARLWQLFGPVIDEYRGQSPRLGNSIVNSHGRIVLGEYYVNVLHKFPNDVPSDFYETRSKIENVFRYGNYVDVFNFVQFMIRFHRGHHKSINRVGTVLEEELCAYRLVGGDTLVAMSSSEEALAIESAILTTKRYGAKGAHAHIRNAVNALNDSDFSGSVRESISAVESLAKVLANEPKAELSKALNRLEQSANIHGAMKTAFCSLYGYASDEKGVRHSLLFRNKADVDESDALFMLGACSSFLSYLIQRANAAGISVESVE